jgi:4-diphosphocytidyl-2-C-methyl-D-erythritol kinase
VSLYDEIIIEASSGQRSITVVCDDSTIPGDETNLASRAAALLCQETGMQAKIRIDLHKHIPAGAGLGGGSSNAAAVLKSLNTLLSLDLSEDSLRTLGARLGADVPFFIPCRPAKVGGIGELLTAAPPLPSRWIVIVVPPFGVSTPWAYRHFDELAPP